MGQLRGLIYLGFIVAVIVGWVITRYRGKQSWINHKPDLNEARMPTPETGIYHSNWNIRLQALETFLADKSGNLLEILLHLLSDPVSDIRLVAISELATYGNDALGGLTNILNTGGLTARESAIQTILAIGTSKTVPILVNSLKFDESAWIRAPAARGLGIIGGEEATVALIHALKDAHPDVNIAVRHALHSIGTPEARHALGR